ncbi:MULTISPECIES: hypothetical protein [unclassified Microcoleus]|uniref:hypothetical protein n=1 Tax=unclassified Microcoleus TaxID=2642155 RepID=UPI002FD031BE
MSKWRSVFWDSRRAIDSIESRIEILALPACQTVGIQVKVFARDRIAKARAREFLRLNKSLAATDDRTNTHPKRIP